MSLLIFSNKCKFSMEVIDFLNQNPQLKQIVSFHNVNIKGIPENVKGKITRVPTMLTKTGKFLVGKEIITWLNSLLPVKNVEFCDFGKCSMTNLSGENNSVIFNLDDYGTSLQPPMTPELEAKINRDVSEAYSNIKK